MIIINLSVIDSERKFEKYRKVQVKWKEKKIFHVSFLFIFTSTYHYFYSFSFIQFSKFLVIFYSVFVSFGYTKGTRAHRTLCSKSTTVTILDSLGESATRRIHRIFHERVSRVDLTGVKEPDGHTVCDEYTEYSFSRWKPQYIATQAALTYSLGCAMIHDEFLVDARLPMRDSPEARISGAPAAYSRSRVTSYRYACVLVFHAAT